MKKVIKKGQPKRFKCNNCGCEFVADHKDYKERYTIRGKYGTVKTSYWSKCPYCKEKVKEVNITKEI